MITSPAYNPTTTTSKRRRTSFCYFFILFGLSSSHTATSFTMKTICISAYTTSSATRISTSRIHSSLPDFVFETIHKGRIAVVENYLSPSRVSQLRSDAQSLYKEPGIFITDSIAGYGAKAGQRDKSKFDPSKDRAVCPAYIPSKKDKLGPFLDFSLGNSNVRKDLSNDIGRLRRQLALGMDRPGIDTDLTSVKNRHEISYTHYGPGAYLKRHTDEHHEELKGVAGWSKPSRRSLSWLIYLNEPDWTAQDGGMLRTFPRLNSPPSNPVGARQGDLQIGWLTPARQDPIERPVFLDGRRDGESGNCALYIDNPNINISGKKRNESGNRLYLTQNFMADPYLFLSTDWVVQHVLIGNPQLGNRFHYVEPPKSLLTEYWTKIQSGSAIGLNYAGEGILDVAPTGGTLVVFDSVTLPHQVMPTLERERWAISGWFHEAQQDIPKKQHRQII